MCNFLAFYEFYTFDKNLITPCGDRTSVGDPTSRALNEVEIFPVTTSVISRGGPDIAAHLAAINGARSRGPSRG